MQDFKIVNQQTWDPNNASDPLNVQTRDGRNLAVRQQDIFGLDPNPVAASNVPQSLMHGTVQVEGKPVDYFYMDTAGEAMGGGFRHTMTGGWDDKLQAWADTRSWTPSALRQNPDTRQPYTQSEVESIYGDLRRRLSADHSTAAALGAGSGRVVGAGIVASAALVAPEILGGAVLEGSSGAVALEGSTSAILPAAETSALAPAALAPAASGSALLTTGESVVLAPIASTTITSTVETSLANMGSVGAFEGGIPLAPFSFPASAQAGMSMAGVGAVATAGFTAAAVLAPTTTSDAAAVRPAAGSLSPTLDPNPTHPVAVENVLHPKLSPEVTGTNFDYAQASVSDSATLEAKLERDFVEYRAHHGNTGKLRLSTVGSADFETGNAQGNHKLEASRAHALGEIARHAALKAGYSEADIQVAESGVHDGQTPNKPSTIDKNAPALRAARGASLSITP